MFQANCFILFAVVYIVCSKYRESGNYSTDFLFVLQLIRLLLQLTKDA